MISMSWDLNNSSLNSPHPGAVVVIVQSFLSQDAIIFLHIANVATAKSHFLSDFAMWVWFFLVEKCVAYGSDFLLL